MIQQNQIDKLLTINEVCEFLQITRQTYYKLCKNPDFPKFIDIGHNIKRYSLKELKHYLHLK